VIIVSSSARSQIADLTPRTASPAAEQAFYFSSGDHQLFGWLHRPSLPERPSLGLVICKPFGYEAVCSHRGIRALAQAAAQAGVPTLRFDYSGTGDSADIDPRADQLQLWSDDVVAAVGELQRVVGVKNVCLLGVRLGAVPAINAARRLSCVHSLVLISPIVSGRRYVRDLKTARLASALGLDAADPTAAHPAQPHRQSDGAIEASGFLLSAATLASLNEVDLISEDAPPVAEMLIIDASSWPIASKWAKSLSSSRVRTEYLALPGLIEMILTMPQDAKTPESILAATRDWLLRNQASLPADNGVRAAPLPPSCPTLELPGVDATPSARLREHPVFLGSNPPAFAVITEPRSDEKRRRGVVLINAGATHHIGPNRMYVSLGRRWAKSGYFVLRLDLCGLGDSATRAGQVDNEVFPAKAIDDIKAAIEYLRTTHGIRDVALCGICSGAYHALRAAIGRLPVSCVLMVNIENFFWDPGTDIHAVVTAEIVKRTRDHRRRVFSWEAWNRLMAGKVNLWRILMIYVRRPLLAIESTVRDWARALRVRMPQDIGWDMEELAARGVQLVFVFARGETGIDLLRIQGGSSVKRMGEHCRTHIVDNADHIFSQAGPREMLETILSKELFALRSWQESARAASVLP
jgi:alpha-beta hydrolase superfamily lysophospholipase